MLFFYKKIHVSKGPHTLKSHLDDLWFFFWEKNQITLLSCFFFRTKIPRKSWVKTPTHPKIFFFSLKNWCFFGKKTKLHCSQAFVVFFLPKISCVKTPTHPKIVFLGYLIFLPQKYPVISAFFQEKKTCVFFGLVLVQNCCQILVGF